MIFTPEHCELILKLLKDQTRRLVKEGDRVRLSVNGKILAVEDKNGRLKYAVGRTYAIQPGRTKPSLWFRFFHDELQVARATDMIADEPWHQYAVYSMAGRDNGWREGRIRITDIRRERLQEISFSDAVAEGMRRLQKYKNGEGTVLQSPITLFKNVWNSINKKKGTRYEDNPEVWCLSFQLVSE